MATAFGMETAKPVAERSDAEFARLTAALAKGDEDAFREIHAAYFDRLWRYLIVVTRGDEHAAEEAIQETFTRVAAHGREFDSAELFWRWLATVARSAATDLARRRSSYWRLLARYSLFAVTPEPDASDLAAEERLAELVDKAAQDLPELDRELVAGKYKAGASVRKLAEQHGLSEKAVDSRLVRARREIREAVLRRLKHESFS